MDEEAITEALGLESAFGYHIERAPRPRAIIHVRERPARQWYPCLDTEDRYTGCLGEACPLEMCWTGRESISYLAALRTRFQPTDAAYAPGACCTDCAHAREVGVPAIDRVRGLIHLPMIHCAHGRWEHPISVPAFVRNRIPADARTDPAHCGDFDQAEAPHPAVEAHRLRTNRLARDRREERAASG